MAGPTITVTGSVDVIEVDTSAVTVTATPAAVTVITAGATGPAGADGAAGPNSISDTTALGSLTADAAPPFLLGGKSTSDYVRKVTEIPLSLLAQTAATSGQVVAWNGSTWVPTTVSASPGGSSGQVQYNNAGAFGGLAASTVATSGTHLLLTAASATDVPFAVKFGSASPTANAIEIRDSSGNVRGGWGPQSTINDSLAMFLRPSGRYFYMGTYEAAGSWKWARSDSSATLEFLPDSTGGIRFNGFSLPYFSGGTANYLYIHSRGDGGTSTLNLNARNDNSSGVGGTVNCWTKTSQTANALAVLAPGGGSTLWAIAPSGATLCASLADSAAPNSSLYYSTTAGKLVWKDSGGTVNNLY